MRNFALRITMASFLVMGCSGFANASPIFTINLSPTTTGLSFATSVFNFTTPVNFGGGPATAILGAPDGTTADPNTPPYVDFGGDTESGWAVSVGFATTFADGPGVDARVFNVQLDPTEGFNLYASADATTFTFLGLYPGPATTVAPRNAIDIDFNGVPLPVNARYLRFVGNQVPVNANTRGLDFDAVGVFPAAAPTAVPEPATLLLLGTGLTFAARRRRDSRT
jgi:hypothetical protein